MMARLFAPVLAVALLLALAGVGYQTKQALNARALYQAERAAFASYRAKAATDQAAAVADEAAKGVRERNTIQEAQDAEHRARVAAQADAAAARTAAVGLRNRAQELATAARCAPRDSALAASSEAADTPADLLAVMLQGVDDAAGTIGEYADAARLAGQLCQRSYQALTPAR
jgi:hypothetical protein